MKSFSKTLLEKKVVDLQKGLKSHIVKSLTRKGVKITASSSKPNHVRFPVVTSEKEWKKYFATMGLAVSDYPHQSISSKYLTYNLTATKKLPGVEKNVSIPWVNSFAGMTASGGQLFKNKELTPDSLGLAGKTLAPAQVMSFVKKALDKRYEKPIADMLFRLLKHAETRKTSVDIDPSLNMKATDLAKISADYGEILAAIWAMNSLRFKKVSFPTRSNEPLVDFYGVRLGIEYPISVKSGGGGKVTIQNIINSIEKRAKTANSADLSKEKSLVIFKTVNEYPQKDGMIELHKVMNTKSIKYLSKISKISVSKMNVKSLTAWISSYSREDQIELLKPWWKVNAHGTPTKQNVLEGPDSYRLIGSPLGQSIYLILNDNKEIKQSLGNVARQVTLIQANVDVSNRKISFQSNYFKDAEFKFSWAGYAGGNKLGFSMIVKK
tara:strand:- start:2426 stop:3736 length:1311 start_codon:yes stop_codon:yes gene_type:complete